jgi:hypothetical protein
LRFAKNARKVARMAKLKSKKNLSLVTPKIRENSFRPDELIPLPQDDETFDALIDTLMHRFEFPNRDHCIAVVANRIMHLPPEQATTTLQYLGDCVRKNIAFQVAQIRGQRTVHEVQVATLVQQLIANPGDGQAFDALQKMGHEGSQIALAAMKKLGIQLAVPPKQELKAVSDPEPQAVAAEVIQENESG